MVYCSICGHTLVCFVIYGCVQCLWYCNICGYTFVCYLWLYAVSMAFIAVSVVTHLCALLSMVMCSIYGHTSGADNRAGWIVVKIDFSQILRQRCNASDYYKWYPTSGVTAHY